jgi:hypothetical protein
VLAGFDEASARQDIEGRLQFSNRTAQVGSSFFDAHAGDPVVGPTREQQQRSVSSLVCSLGAVIRHQLNVCLHKFILVMGGLRSWRACDQAQHQRVQLALYGGQKFQFSTFWCLCNQCFKGLQGIAHLDALPGKSRRIFVSAAVCVRRASHFGLMRRPDRSYQSGNTVFRDLPSTLDKPSSTRLDRDRRDTTALTQGGFTPKLRAMALSEKPARFSWFWISIASMLSIRLTI